MKKRARQKQKRLMMRGCNQSLSEKKEKKKRAKKEA